MNPELSSRLAAAIILGFLLPLNAIASEEDRAIQLCESKIKDVYGVSNFRHVSSEREGNHKFLVNGKVRYDDHKYDFNCKVKHGEVRSYAYSGPHKRHRDDHDDEDSNVGAVIAVGAGLAILAAIAASQSDDNDESDRGSTLSVSKSVLEDDCHDTLQYRIRDEHDYSARVNLKDSRIDGHNLVGNARVKYDRDDPQHATYTCHFDSRGRLLDSSYHLY
jgi:hypothetical protein